MSSAKPIVLVLLAASLVANAALLGLFVTGRASADAAAEATAKRRAAESAPRPAITAPAAPGPGTWTTLQGGTPAELVARLRAAGFPVSLQRAILYAHMREAAGERLKALDSDSARRPFWHNPIQDSATQLASRQIYREMQQTVRELLGEDDDELNNFYQGRRLDGLSPAKASDVRAVLREFDDRRSDVYAGSGGMIMGGSEAQKRLDALEQDQRNAIRQLLTAEEFADYELRNSATSQALRSMLSAFEPSEQEFRAIFALQADFDQRFGRLFGMPSPDEQRARSEAQRQLTEQIKANLTPERAAAYERSQNYDYRQAAQLVGRLGLPSATLDQLWTIQKSFEDRRGAVYRDHQTDVAARNAALTALQAEARTAVAPVIGERYVDTYTQYGGTWLRSLAPPTPRPGLPATPVPRN